jgi:hypothetical protein
MRAEGALSAREAAIVLCAVHHPAVIEADAEAFARMRFSHPLSRRLQALLLDRLAKGETLWSLAELEPETGLRIDLFETAARAETWAQPGVDPERVREGFRDALELEAREGEFMPELDAACRAFVLDAAPSASEALRAMIERREGGSLIEHHRTPDE